MLNRRLGLMLVGLCAATLMTSAAVLLPHDARAQGAPPAPPVQVSAPLAQRVTNWDEFTGRFEASEQVEVRARVSGFLDVVHFKDGDIVKKGDLLFTIDPRPYRLAVDAARAEVARAKAQVELAQNEVERAEGLTQNRTITARDVDQRRAPRPISRRPSSISNGPSCARR
jgi:multidrug efflux system membrane fusion protein